MPISGDEWNKARTVSTPEERIMWFLKRIYPKAATSHEIEVGVLAEEQGISETEAVKSQLYGDTAKLVLLLFTRYGTGQSRIDKALGSLVQKGEVESKEITDGYSSVATTHYRAHRPG